MNLSFPIFFSICVLGSWPDNEVNLKVEKALKCIYNSMKWNYLFQAHKVLFESKPYFISRCMGRTKKKYIFHKISNKIK